MSLRARLLLAVGAIALVDGNKPTTLTDADLRARYATEDGQKRWVVERIGIVTPWGKATGHVTLAAARPFTIDGGQITLSAEIKREKETKEGDHGERVLHSERMYGKVSRSFTLPQDIDDAAAQAKFTDGVLELTLPKKTAAVRKQITIQ